MLNSDYISIITLFWETGCYTESSILSNLESHYSGEFPEYVSNQHIASDEVMT